MKIGGITLFPLIILREHIKDNHLRKVKTINHESIHIEQQGEIILLALILLVILNLLFGLMGWWLVPILAYSSFYIWYVIEWFIKIFMYGGSPNKAYHKISFEQEAYDKETDYWYIADKRKRFAWIKYLFKK
jgi:hypothetical protein